VTVATAPAGTEVSRKRLPLTLAAAVLAAAFVTVGLVGLTRYLRNYWLYRGFPPPRDPAFVSQPGRRETIHVRSAALGGRSQQVIVYLPAAYDAQSSRRFPVVYLLHGFPGRPTAFLETVRVGVVDDILAAKGIAQPAILVMPFGSTGTFTDKEWANGTRRGEAWETFVAREVVRAVDARYRTIPTAAGRALAGLSEGGYGSLNIGLHHPGEFRVLESWSGYERADDLASIFGRDPARLAFNSPNDELPTMASALRKARTYVWFYSGSTDPLRAQNSAFARELARYRIPRRFFLVRGGHNWALWRGQAGNALSSALVRLAHG
jgi:enterochelin esterase-like enzyme